MSTFLTGRQLRAGCEGCELAVTVGKKKVVCGVVRRAAALEASGFPESDAQRRAALENRRRVPDNCPQNFNK